MNRSDYLSPAIIAQMNAVRDRANVEPDRITRGIDGYNAYLKDLGLDPEVDDQYSEARGNYVATSLASDAERSAEMFRDNEDLKEVHLDYQIGRHERVRTIVSREYENDEGDTENCHMLIEHNRTNTHIEGIQRMAHAYAKITFVDQED